MFGFISKKKLIKEAVRLYNLESTERASDEKDLYFRMGNANALNFLCSQFGVNLVKIISERKTNCGADMRGEKT